MGEISEALKRARLEREAQEPPLSRGLPPRPETPRTPLGEPLAPRDEAPAEPRAEVPEVHIDRTKSPGWPARAVAVAADGPIAQRFRKLAIRVEQQLHARRTRTIVLTSAEQQEGKTLTSCNLALALASLGRDRRVALVDLDLRKPAVARYLGLDPKVGIEEALEDPAILDSVRVPTDFHGLDVYPVAKHQRAPHALLSSEGLDAVLRQLETRYSTLIIDTPPILPVPDVALIAPRVGACLMVARAGATRTKALRDALRSLPSGFATGVFVNGAAARAGNYYRAYEEPGEDLSEDASNG